MIIHFITNCFYLKKFNREKGLIIIEERENNPQLGYID
jgi:hypothetical protein